MTIHEYLLYYREKNHLTQEQLAQVLFVSRQAVSKWERGESLPDIENIIRLSDLYDISIDELLRGAKYLKKPFSIGEDRIGLHLLLSFFLSLLVGIMLSSGYFLVEVFLIAFGFQIFVFNQLKEGKITLNRNKVVITSYQNFFQKLHSLMKPSHYQVDYPYDLIDLFSIDYRTRGRTNPFDTGANVFKVIVSTHDGKSYSYNVVHRVSNQLPILSDFLIKKGVAIHDPYNIIKRIVMGEDVFESLETN